MRALPKVDVNRASILMPLVYRESNVPVLIASDSPIEERGMSVHPVNVSREPGALPFQSESPWRVSIRVWVGPIGSGAKHDTKCINDRIVAII